MSGAMDAVRAIVAIAVGVGIGYFWSTTRPQDDISIVAGVGLVSFVILFFLLKQLGKG